MASKVAVISVVAGVASGVIAALATSWLSRPNEAGSGPGHDPGHPSSAAEDLARETEEHAKGLRAHDMEPRDPIWSVAAARSYEAELRELSRTAEFEVASVDCRSRSCAATLRWASFHAAFRHREEVLRQRHAVNCAIRIFTPRPPDPASAYEMTVLFPDCAGRE